eukprot:scaffold288788_cov26-Tisochrysis_lutea.AAC.2
MSAAPVGTLVKYSVAGGQRRATYGAHVASLSKFSSRAVSALQYAFCWLYDAWIRHEIHGSNPRLNMNSNLVPLNMRSNLVTDDVSHTSGSLKVALCMAPYMSTTDDVSKYVGKRFNCRDSNRFTMLVTWAMMPEGQGV